MFNQIGDTVQLHPCQTALNIELGTPGQAYGNVFIEPQSPIRCAPLAVLRRVGHPLVTLEEGQTSSSPLFMAKLAALQLKATLPQQDISSTANFRNTSLPHQVLAVGLVMNLLRPRALMTDEVELGKTIEAALIHEELKLRGQGQRTIIITSAVQTRQWQDEPAQKFGESFVTYDRTMVSTFEKSTVRKLTCGSCMSSSLPYSVLSRCSACALTPASGNAGGASLRQIHTLSKFTRMVSKFFTLANG